MKKCLAAILAVLYLSTSMGATVHLHYCMGQLAAWTLQDPTADGDFLCGMPQIPASGGCSLAQKDCCRDEYHQIKTGTDQKLGSTALGIVKGSAAAATLPRAVAISPYVTPLALTVPAANGPPINSGVPVFLRNCTFRI